MNPLDKLLDAPLVIRAIPPSTGPLGNFAGIAGSVAATGAALVASGNEALQLNKLYV